MYQLVCKLFIFSFSCLQTIYLGFFDFANNFFQDFSSPPPLQKNNGPSLRAGCPKMPGRTIEIRSFKNYSKIGFVHDLMSIAAQLIKRPILTPLFLHGINYLQTGCNLRSGSIFVSLGETFRRDGRNEKQSLIQFFYGTSAAHFF